MLTPTQPKWTRFTDAQPEHGVEHYCRDSQGVVFRIDPMVWAKYVAFYGPRLTGEWSYDRPVDCEVF